jgi:Domain of unknown function (DUF4082)
MSKFLIGTPSAPGRNNFTGAVGCFFTVSTSWTITRLGRYFDVPTSNSHGIKIWQANNPASLIAGGGTLIVAATILGTDPSDANGYKWVGISPVTLTSGNTYCIVVDEANGGDKFNDLGWSPTKDATVTILTNDACFTATPGNYPSSLQTGANSIYSTPNFSDDATSGQIAIVADSNAANWADVENTPFILQPVSDTNAANWSDTAALAFAAGPLAFQSVADSNAANWSEASLAGSITSYDFLVGSPPTLFARTLAGSYGCSFTVSRQWTVTRLGRWYDPANTHDHQITLWAPDQTTILARATILAASASDADGYKWVSVNPVALTPGNTYSIATDEASPGDTWKDTASNGTGWTPDGFHREVSVSIVTSRFTSTPGAYPSSAQLAGATYSTPNFDDNPAAVFDSNVANWGDTRATLGGERVAVVEAATPPWSDAVATVLGPQPITQAVTDSNATNWSDAVTTLTDSPARTQSVADSNAANWASALAITLTVAVTKSVADSNSANWQDAVVITGAPQSVRVTKLVIESSLASTDGRIRVTKLVIETSIGVFAIPVTKSVTDSFPSWSNAAAFLVGSHASVTDSSATNWSDTVRVAIYPSPVMASVADDSSANWSDAPAKVTDPNPLTQELADSIVTTWQDAANYDTPGDRKSLADDNSTNWRDAVSTRVDVPRLTQAVVDSNAANWSDAASTAVGIHDLTHSVADSNALNWSDAISTFPDHQTRAVADSTFSNWSDVAAKATATATNLTRLVTDSNAANWQDAVSIRIGTPNLTQAVVDSNVANWQDALNIDSPDRKKSVADDSSTNWLDAIAITIRVAAQAVADSTSANWNDTATKAIANAPSLTRSVADSNAANWSNAVSKVTGIQSLVQAVTDSTSTNWNDAASVNKQNLAHTVADDQSANWNDAASKATTTAATVTKSVADDNSANWRDAVSIVAPDLKKSVADSNATNWSDAASKTIANAASFAHAVADDNSANWNDAVRINNAQITKSVADAFSFADYAKASLPVGGVAGIGVGQVYPAAAVVEGVAGTPQNISGGQIFPTEV